MLNATVIGHVGGDAVYRNENGKEFVSFRVAHTSKWTSENGEEHESTQWVDCVLNGRPKVTDFLKKGQLVYVAGLLSSRVYSSPKDRCMKAGLSISVRQLELLGGKSDDIPSRLYDESSGAVLSVNKYYNVAELQRDASAEEFVTLVSRSGEHFAVDRDGWVSKIVDSQ